MSRLAASSRAPHRSSGLCQLFSSASQTSGYRRSLPGLNAQTFNSEDSGLGRRVDGRGEDQPALRHNSADKGTALCKEGQSVTPEGATANYTLCNLLPWQTQGNPDYSAAVTEDLRSILQKNLPAGFKQDLQIQNQAVASNPPKPRKSEIHR